MVFAMSSKLELPIVPVDNKELYSPPEGIVIRAGLIPFTIKDNQRYYLLGLFNDHVFTDMGGGCKSSLEERPIDCLTREIKEEADDQTAQVIVNLLNKIDYNSRQVEVWRQTGPSFRSLGYPFRQYLPGPVYKYYVLLHIDDPEMKLGGPTQKEEVGSYIWVSVDQLKKYPTERFNQSCQDFMSRYLTTGVMAG